MTPRVSRVSRAPMTDEKCDRYTTLYIMYCPCPPSAALDLLPRATLVLVQQSFTSSLLTIVCIFLHFLRAFTSYIIHDTYCCAWRRVGDLLPLSGKAGEPPRLVTLATCTVVPVISMISPHEQINPFIISPPPLKHYKNMYAMSIELGSH